MVSLSHGTTVRRQISSAGEIKVVGRRLMLILLAGLIAGSSLGCASKTPRAVRDIRVDTMNVKGAECKGSDNRGHLYLWNKTPAMVTVSKDAFPLMLTCRKAGFKKTVRVLDGRGLPFPADESFQGYLRRGLSAMVQAFGGELPSVERGFLVRIPMEPEDFASGKAKEAYRRAKQKAEGRVRFEKIDLLPKRSKNDK